MPNELIEKLNQLAQQLDQTNDPELSDKIKPLIDQVQTILKILVSIIMKTRNSLKSLTKLLQN